MTDQEPTSIRLAKDLIALGQHLLTHEGLPEVGNVRESYFLDDFLSIQLSGGSPVDLAAWAQTLTDVSSHVQRLTVADAVHAYVFGRIGGRRVRVWSAVSGEMFPDTPGDHEWDVTALLQEA